MQPARNGRDLDDNVKMAVIKDSFLNQKQVEYLLLPLVRG